MPTQKTRINLTVPNDINRIVNRLAKRDQLSVSTKTLDLIIHALEMDEDIALLTIVQSREESTKKPTYIDHSNVWK